MLTELHGIAAASLLLLVPAAVGAAVLPVLGAARPAGRLSSFPVSYAFGVVVWGVFNALGFAWGAPLDLMFLAYAIVALIGVATWVRQYRRVPRVLSDPELGILLGGCVLALGYLILGTADTVGSDSSRHLIFVRKLFERDTLAEDSFIFSTLFPYNWLNASYAYNSVYTLVAGVARATATDPVLLWHYGSPLLLPVFITALWTWAYYVGGYRYAVGAVAVAWLLAYWAATAAPMREVVYPRTIGSIVFLMLMIAVIRLLEKRDVDADQLATAGALGVSSGFLLTLHVQWWLFAGVSLLVGMLLTCAGRGAVRRRTGIVLLAGFAAASAALLPLRRSLDGTVSSTVSFSTAGLGERLWIVSALPTTVWIALGAAAIYGWRNWGRVHRRQAVILALLFGPLAMLFGSAFFISEAGLVTHIVLADRVGVYMLLMSAPFVAWVCLDTLAVVKRQTARRPQLARAAALLLLVLVGWLYLGRAIAKVTVGFGTELARYRLRQLLSAELRELETWIAIVAAVVVLAAGIAVMLLISRDPGERHPKWTWRVGPAFFGASLLLSPGPAMSLWQEWARDSYYDRYRGPGLMAYYRSGQLSALIQKIPSGSVVLTDVPEQLLSIRDVMVPAGVKNMGRASERLYGDWRSMVADTTLFRILWGEGGAPTAEYILLSAGARAVLPHLQRAPEFTMVGEAEGPGSAFDNVFTLYKLSALQED